MNRFNEIDFRRIVWLGVTDRMSHDPGESRVRRVASEVRARTEFESSTGGCQQDIEKYQ